MQGKIVSIIPVGACEGTPLAVGAKVGEAVVGASVGWEVGDAVGVIDGTRVGIDEGPVEGLEVGC